jgi:predicted RNA-binding Zn ribbon-like protein
MAVEWTAHRFSGGVLALDVANTVVLRNDSARRFDRFDDPGEIARFAAVATVLRADELQGAELTVANIVTSRSDIVRLREATDGLFRDAVEHKRLESYRLSELLSACSSAVSGSGDLSLNAKRDAIGFQAAVAMSALDLLHAERLSRLRICSNCGWLFLDRSRNASRIWCDMAVCGNRSKAARHYKRLKRAGEGNDGPMD